MKFVKHRFPPPRVLRSTVACLMGPARPHQALASAIGVYQEHIVVPDEFHEDGPEQKMAIAWHKSRGLCVVCRPKAAVGR